MKETKKVTRKCVEEIVVAVTCDICKKEYKGDNWECWFDDIKRTVVGYQNGKEGSDDCDSYGETVSFDVCPDCFVNRLIPALKEMGAEPTITEWGRW